MWSIVIAVSAVVPSILIGWYFHKRDIFPEPGKIIWITFFLGVLTVVPLVPLELAISAVLSLVPVPLVNGFLEAFLTAAVPEELFKLLVLVGFAYRRHEFDEPMDGIVYGVMASLGFATLENVLYVMKGGMAVAVMRALTSVPSHAAEGAIMGYFVGRAKFMPSGRAFTIFKGYAAAVVLHGFYDFPLLSMSAAEAAAGGGPVSGFYVALTPITAIALLVSAGWAWFLARKVRAEQKTLLPPPLPEALERLRNRNRVVGSIMLIAGFGAAALGGMMSLGVLAALIFGGAEGGELVSIVTGGFIVGVLPLAGGVVLFGAGIGRLNKAFRVTTDLPPGIIPPPADSQAGGPPPLAGPGAGA